jgi:energy-coupling factor transporter ATP-binding protein EcfA2
MKLARLQIENFRHLGTREKPLELDFTDALGRVRDFTLLVGPNTSGKTTILDAIAAALGRSVGMAALRPHLKLSPRSIVRRGELHAKVTCWLRFSPDEIAATRDIFRLAEISKKVPDAPEVKLTWTYAAPRAALEFAGSTTAMSITGPISFSGLNPGQWQWSTANTIAQPEQDYGVIQCEPEMGWVLLHGRDQLARLLATGRADWSWFHRVGGVFTFDQERTGLGKTISRQVWNIIHGMAEAAREKEELQTTDPRTILIELALQSLVPSIGSPGQVPDEFRLVQERYAHVCAPRRIVGAVRDELREFDIHFTDGQHEYTYDGLSSGEKNVLLLLIRFVAERMHQSVVLIDELELNQHPLWQRKLVHLLPRMGEGNQIIATTHSSYLRDAVSPQAVRTLGDLGEVHDAGGA